MKKVFALMMITLFLSSCLDDDNDLYYWEGRIMGVAYPTDDNDFGFNILLDSDYGDASRIVAIPKECDLDYTPSEEERVIVYVKFLEAVSDTSDVAVLSLASIVACDAIVANAAALDTLTNDPLFVSSDDLDVNHTYMDVSYAYKRPYAYASHSVDLVYYADSTDADGRVMLKLQHSANGDVLHEESVEGYKCFDLKSIPVFNEVVDSLNYIVKINSGDYDGSDYFTGTYYAPVVLK